MIISLDDYVTIVQNLRKYKIVMVCDCFDLALVNKNGQVGL